MILGILTVLIMLAVAYSFWHEGLLTACTMCVNVFLAGLIAFNFFELLAGLLDPMFADLFLHGWEDALCLMFLFGFSLGMLRLFTNSFANSDLEYPPILLRAGCAIFGLITGYLLSGVIVCILQTVPWHENFMGFEYKLDSASPTHGIRSVLPPDRVWLGLMQRAGAYAFANYADEDVKNPESGYERHVTFDKYSTFELRYARHRRYTDDREPLPDLGEFDRQVHRRRN